MGRLRHAKMWKTAPLALGLFLFLGNCAPQARYVACENDTQCKDHGGKLRYCTMSHCVECVGNSVCPSGTYCDEGSCVAKTARSGAGDVSRN